MTKGSEELVYLALGGAGEIGMNCYLYGLGSGDSGAWIMVDLGIGFGDMDTAPGVEVILPDIDFIAARRERLHGIFLTHAHEDHIGAVPHLWARLNVPVYARPFTAEVLRRKLGEADLDPTVVRVAEVGKGISAGPFEVSFLPVTHSIPEASMLAIRTKLGTVVHSGDFKLDPAPQMGDPMDLSHCRELGKEGVLAFACESTNVFLEGSGRSEEVIIADLERIVGQAEGAVAATTFASNVARLRTLALAAQKAGRSIVVAGRAMRRMISAAVETGLLTDFPTTISEEEAKDLPRENLFYLVTGSQGEARAAVARISQGSHPSVALDEGDTILFSSKTIPGNEAAVHRIYNRLSERGVKVIDGDMEPIHVSGHARRGDLERIIKLLKPRVSIPIHGEHRHLVEHAVWAEEWGAKPVLAPNGALVRLDGDAPEVVDHVETGRVYLDGTARVGAMDGVIRQRLKMARQGHVAVAVVVDAQGEPIATPQVRCSGTPMDGGNCTASSDGAGDETEGAIGDWAAAETVLADAIEDAVRGASSKKRCTDKGVEEIVNRTIRGVAGRLWGKRPVTAVLITRLEG